MPSMDGCRNRLACPWHQVLKGSSTLARQSEAGCVGPFDVLGVLVVWRVLTPEHRIPFQKGSLVNSTVQRFVASLRVCRRGREEREKNKARPSQGLVHIDQGRVRNQNRWSALLLPGTKPRTRPDGGIGRHDRLKLC